jgi:hypothetical protein
MNKSEKVFGRISGELVPELQIVVKIYCLWAEGPAKVHIFTCIFQVVESVSICMQLSLFANTNPYNGNKIVINNCYLYPGFELALQKTLLTFFYSGKHFRFKSFLYNQLLIQLQISLSPILIILFIIPEFNYFIKKT